MDDRSSDAIGNTWLLLNQAYDAVYRVTSEKLRHIGISPEQARLLFALSRSSNPPTRIEISQILMRKPHTITALLNRMQSAGLISRIIDRENKKLVRVVVTPKGAEALRKVLRVQVERKMMVFLSSEEFH